MRRQTKAYRISFWRNQWIFNVSLLLLFWLDIAKVVVEDNARREIDDRIPPVNDDATGEINAEDKRGKNVSSRRLRGVIPLFSRVSNDDGL